MKEKFDVKGMSCAACQAHVNKAVSSLDGVNSCNVNLLLNSMEVDFDESKITTSMIEDAVKNAGYEAISLNTSSKSTDKSSSRLDLSSIKLITSFVFLIILMYVSMAPMFGWVLPTILEGTENALIFAFTQLILTMPIVLIYSKYFTNGFRLLFKGKPNMDSLIAIGASASLLYGIFAIYMMSYGLGHDDLELVHTYMHNLYFDSAAMILTLVSLGKYLESLSKKKTTKAIEELVNIAPKTVRLLKNGQEVIVKVETIQIGDIIVCKKGDLIGVDGKIVEGSGSIDESNITGESMPIHKKEKDLVYASTILKNGYIKIETLKRNEESSISTIIKLVEEASSSKAPISKLVDKISLYFVPTIIGLAIIDLIVWIVVGLVTKQYDFATSFNFAISMLVIACPCALGLATPLAIMVGVGKGAKNGLLIKNAEILEKAHLIKTIVFDKTGTLTEGNMNVTDFIVRKKTDAIKIKSIVYSLENLSEHPLANSIIEWGKKNNLDLISDIKEFKSIEGVGIEGKINNDLYQIGNTNVLPYELEKSIYKNEYKKFIEEGKNCLFITKSNAEIGLICLKDNIKANTIDAILELKKIGVDVVMLTGDNKEVAMSIAKEVGIDNVISEADPIKKQEVIKSFKKDEKHLIAMVGDGVNDALALTSADLSISLSKASDVAIETSDIILIRNDLLDLRNVIQLSRRIIYIIKINLFWAFIYNLIGVLIASGIFYYSFNLALNPMIASAAMSISSVLVVFSSLTINLFKVKRMTN